MKHNVTFRKMNLNNNDPFILRIKKMKSNKRLFDTKKYNNINTFSSNQLINPEIKKFFYFYNERKLSTKFKNNKQKKEQNPQSYSNKIIKVNTKKILNSFSNENHKNDSNNRNSFQKLNYIENFKTKLNHKKGNCFDIFYNKENLLLMKSFNDYNDQIRKNINKRIINKSSKFLQKQKLNTIPDKNKTIVNNRNNVIKNRIRNLLKIDNIINHKNKTKENKQESNKNNIYYGFNRNLSNLIITKKEAFHSLNSKICFPIYMNDKIIMNDYSNKNHLEYQKYIKTQ